MIKCNLLKTSRRGMFIYPYARLFIHPSIHPAIHLKLLPEMAGSDYIGNMGIKKTVRAVGTQ